MLFLIVVVRRGRRRRWVKMLEDVVSPHCAALLGSILRYNRPLHQLPVGRVYLLILHNTAASVACPRTSFNVRYEQSLFNDDNVRRMPDFLFRAILLLKSRSFYACFRNPNDSSG